MKILTLTYITVMLFCFGCTFQKKKNPVVVNYGNKIARAEFVALELDSVYVNLLTTAQTEEEGDTLYIRWLSFHKNLASRVR